MRPAHAHEIARPIGGQQGRGRGQGEQHLLGRLADAEPAQRIAGKIKPDQGGCTLGPQFHVGAALHDGEQGLVRAALGVAAALRPVNGSPHRFTQILRPHVGRWAFIQAHGDVRAEVFLNGDGALRAELQRGAVDVRLEHRCPVVDSPAEGEAIDLKAAAVGEDRPVPAHEPVQPAQIGDQPVSGPERQMIGVAQNNAGAAFFQLPRRQPFDGRLRADRHEDGRLHAAMRRFQDTGPSGAISRQHLKAKRHVKNPKSEPQIRNPKRFRISDLGFRIFLSRHAASVQTARVSRAPR